jgi:hypothetical protein
MQLLLSLCKNFHWIENLSIKSFRCFRIHFLVTMCTQLYFQFTMEFRGNKFQANKVLIGNINVSMLSNTR